ncbi:MAG TPA: hypothetical protein VF572_04250 [Candidatus Saccharimonadales bacterium]|jgi:hypothetical protein
MALEIYEDETAELPCKDKLAFDTQREAASSANVVQYRYGNAMHVYRCRFCQLWHLSSGQGAD